MAKTLAQGRKPGSGRKPGKGKTLREGRKPGSGRRRRADDDGVKRLERGYPVDQTCERADIDFFGNTMSTRDLEAVDALRELNSSPSQQLQKNPQVTTMPLPKQLRTRIETANERRSQEGLRVLAALNKNGGFTDQFTYSRGAVKPILMESSSIAGILREPIALSQRKSTQGAHDDYDRNPKDDHIRGNDMNNAKQTMDQAGAAEKVLIST